MQKTIQSFKVVSDIGRIPEDWQWLRCRYVFREINDRSEDGSEDLLSVSEYYGVAKRADKIDEDDFLTRAETLEGYKKLSVGDLAMNIMLAWKRGLGVSNYNGIISPSYSVFRLLDGANIPEYFHYLLRLDVYTAEFRRHSTGIIDSRLRLYPDVFADIPILVPPPEMQNRIVGYLHKKLAIFEKMLENKQALIALLEEERLAIINQTVTKGLRPDAVMFDTNVFDKLLEGNVALVDLPDDLIYYVTHVQYDEIQKMSNHTKKERLLRLVRLVGAEEVPTSVFVLDYSRLDKAELGGDPDFDKLTGGNKKHIEDAIILLTAKKRKAILISEDDGAPMRRAANLGYDVMTLQAFIEKYGLKESGVEWIGKIPKNWEMKCLKYLVQMQFSNVNKKQEEGEIDVVSCNYVDVYKNDAITKDLEFLPITGTANEIARFTIKKGDVLVTKDSETADDIAVPALVTEDLDGVLCGYHLAMIRPHALHSTYLFRLFQSPSYNVHFEVSANGVTRFGLGMDAFGSAFTPVPPMQEQIAIAQHVEHEVNRIKQTITKINKEIELLQEYRTALISEAVTGKIDVRGYA